MDFHLITILFLAQFLRSSWTTFSLFVLVIVTWALSLFPFLTLSLADVSTKCRAWIDTETVHGPLSGIVRATPWPGRPHTPGGPLTINYYCMVQKYRVFQINWDCIQVPIAQELEHIERRVIVHLKACPIIFQMILNMHYSTVCLSKYYTFWVIYV